MPELDPNEVVKARFVHADHTSEFTFVPSVKQEADFTGKITYGDIVNLPRLEATQREDFEIVGEESTTNTSAKLPEAPLGVQEEPGESVVAPPPAPQTDATTDTEEN